MNTTNPYLYEEVWREQCRQIRREVAINRLFHSQPRNGVLLRTANLLVRIGTALQRYREQQLMHRQTYCSIDTTLLKEYY